MTSVTKINNRLRSAKTPDKQDALMQRKLGHRLTSVAGEPVSSLVHMQTNYELARARTRKGGKKTTSNPPARMRIIVQADVTCAADLLLISR